MAYEKGYFKYDDEVVGKVGEDHFKDWFCKTRGLYCIDVSKELIWQIADIDFLTSEEELDYTKDIEPNLRNIIMHSKGIFKNYHKVDVTKYEVKTDTVSLNSRNVIYEVISHNHAGCLGECKADYVYYVFVDNTLEVKEVWLIDLVKWREYCNEYFFKDKGYHSREKKIWTNYYKPKQEEPGTGNILFNIEMLAADGVVERIL